ncbi:histidine kinase [Sporosarcina sp. YIM B06819]|uniref:histidine kinase n=1 Tax=Sporosarcina sp. YIM B06819 TaxID=3081769 RepID=UPI00298CFA7F|nr:histidine kinase [Sporosarcina sp. YIM B06819]
MRAFKYIIPVMMIVGTVSIMMLNKSHQDVPPMSRIYITLGAMVVSGIISYFLFPKDEEKN